MGRLRLVRRYPVRAQVFGQGGPQVFASVAGRPAREVFDFGREIQLTEWRRALNAVFFAGRVALEYQWMQIRASGVNRGSPACRAGSDNDDFFWHMSLVR